MAILTTGNTFSDGDQVTSTKLNNIANGAAFASGSVDDSTTQISGGAIIIKDLGVSTGKIAASAVTTSKIASDVVISTSGSITGAAGSFTTLAASGDISVDGSVKQSGNTGNLILKGGDTDGANIELYGSSSSEANKAFYDASTHSFRPEDGSSNRFVISSSGITASGDVTFDTTTLKVDSTNNRVGIGTASPTQPLDVNGQARVVGNLFVGTDDTTPNGMIEVYGGGTGQNEGGEIRLRTAADFDTTYNHYFIDAYQDDLRIGREGGADITLTSAGKVGIGTTTTPTEKLQVVGHVRIGDGGGVDDDLILKGSDGIGPSSVGGSTSAAIITTNGIPTAAGHVGIEVPSNDNDDGFYVATDPNQTGTADLLALKINALGKVGIGETNPSAPLTVTSTTGGVLLPRMTTTQKNAISSPSNGEMVYDTDLNKFYGYANGSWVALH